MKTKSNKYFGKVLSFKYKDWKKEINGIVLCSNDNWTLLKYNPADYIIDGYIVFNHKNLEDYRRGHHEKFAEKIFRIKGISASEQEIIPIDNLETILTWVTQKHGVFLIQLKAENAAYLGRLKSYTSKELKIQFLGTDGKWRRQISFRPGEIRIIEFDTDYINSLKLVSDNG